MKIKPFLALGIILLKSASVLHAQTEKPLVNEKLVFDEKDGMVAVEAELFYNQMQTVIRKWHIISSGKLPAILPDPDKEHINGASNNAYIEILPDTRITHSDTLTDGVNFSGTPGKMAITYYKVKINKPGRYYVWVRCYSTGSEDNGLHVGINDSWPEHGQRMQWCDNKNDWTWASRQRTENAHCGVPKEIYLDINKAGIYDIQFSMREDGFEMDKFILTTNIDYIPEGEGPPMEILKGKLPSPFPKVEDDLKH